jgi:hypothetical protein
MEIPTEKTRFVQADSPRVKVTRSIQYQRTKPNAAKGLKRAHCQRYISPRAKPRPAPPQHTALNIKYSGVGKGKEWVSKFQIEMASRNRNQPNKDHRKKLPASMVISKVLFGFITYSFYLYFPEMNIHQLNTQNGFQREKKGHCLPG